MSRATPLVLLAAALLLAGCATPFERKLREAQEGNAFAQYHVGMVYGTGKGGTLSGDKPVERNPAESVRWLQKASDGGNGRASLSLALYHYYRMPGIRKDFTNYRTAYALFEKALARGETDAYYWIGLCKLKGRGTDQDVAGAVDCFRKGAEEPNETAKFCMAEIGGCYLYGYGVGLRRSYSESRRWYQRAAENGDLAAKDFLVETLTMSFFRSVDPDRKEAATSGKGFRIKSLDKDGERVVAEAELLPDADRRKAVRELKEELLADCENDLLFSNRDLDRGDISWETDFRTEGNLVHVSLRWHYVHTVRYDYNDATRVGHIVISLSSGGYGDAKDYIVKNIREICETKLVAIRDGRIPDGAKFRIGDEVRNPDGTLTVEFEAIN